MTANLSTLEKAEWNQQTNHQALIQAKTGEISVLTKTIEDRTVEKVKSDLTEAMSLFSPTKRLLFKLGDSCTIPTSDWEEHERVNAEASVSGHL